MLEFKIKLQEIGDGEYNALINCRIATPLLYPQVLWSRSDAHLLCWTRIYANKGVSHAMLIVFVGSLHLSRRRGRMLLFELLIQQSSQNLDITH